MNSLYKKRVFLQPFKCCKNTRHGAGGRTRTGTPSLAVDFESTTSTNSITPARWNIFYTMYPENSRKISKKHLRFLHGQRQFLMSNAGRNCLDKREVSAIVQNMLENLETKCCRLVVIAPVTPIENRMIAVHIEFFYWKRNQTCKKPSC